MFRNHMMQRITAGVVLTTFVSLSMYPLTAAAQAKAAIEKAGLLPKQKDEGIVGNAKRYINKLGGSKAATAAPAADERFAQLLNEIHEDLKAAVPHTAMPKEAHKYASGKSGNADQSQAITGTKDGKQTRAIGPTMRIETDSTATIKPLPGTDIAAKINSIRNKAVEVKGLYAETDKSFKDTEQHLKNAKLPQEILERHNQAVFQYESRKAEFDRLIGKIEQAPANSADQQSALADLGSFMAKHPNAKPHQYTDPNNLPFRTPNGKVREPHLTKEQYQASLFPPKYNKVMLAGTIPDGLRLAQATLPEVPNAPDTAETEDVQITQAIRDKAAELNNNPVQIYNWVRNNIAFIPSYGSIQGSDMTLMNKRGNAFDTASLLIALYRAAGIPARYVYGTIEVPADKVMNWVGGVTKPQAAQSLLGQGGIPNVALVSGGTVKAIRMEHVWVEAYVDYTPSRGAINKTPNTWVPMDASFKQYQFTQGMNIKGNVQLNAQNLLDQIKQGATINEAEGYVQNLNQANLQAELTQYQNQVKTYIENQKANATVGDVLGTQIVKVEEHGVLLGSLPYKTVTVGSKFQTLPDRLKWKFKTNIYAGGGYGDSSSPYIEINQGTAKLAGKKITLSFVPASQADQDLVNSYLPKPHADGTPIQPSELPKTLPGYLLKMKAEFRIDGQLASQTSEIFQMGREVKQSSQYFNPSLQSWDGGDDNPITVGEYNAIGIDLQGIGSQQLLQLQAKLEATKAKLLQHQTNLADISSINGLTKEDVIGDIVQSGILGYFMSVDSSDRFIARSEGNIVSYRLPSYGRFFTNVQTYYWFGIARNVSFPGVGVDIDYLFQHSEAKDSNPSDRAKFNRQAGAAGSFAENSIPELMFRNPDLPVDDPSQPQGVSAIKALGYAAAQGQRIYTLNQSNQNLHSTILQALQISPDVKAEIANGLNSGKEVTVHHKNISVNGWVGSGYLILDPITGAGAYKISGGTNGGMLNFDSLPQAGLAALLIAGLLFFLAATGPVAALLLISGGFLAATRIASAIGFIANILLTSNYSDYDSILMGLLRFSLVLALFVMLPFAAGAATTAATMAVVFAALGLIYNIYKRVF